MNKKNYLLKSFLRIMIGTTFFFSMTGCSLTENIKSIIDPNYGASGGTTNHTDPNAPKVIESKNITGFSCRIYLTGDWGGDYDGQEFEFDITPGENNQLMAYEYVRGAELPADEELLTSLQELIDNYKLVSQNGVYKVTEGLPPEFQKITFKAEYDSGEKLSFTVNNSPDEEWEMALYLLFANWFDKNGVDVLNAPDVKRKVTRLDIKFEDKKNQIRYEYNGINVSDEDAIDGENHLFMKYTYDLSSDEVIDDKLALYPDDFYDKVTDIVNAYDIRPFDKSSVLFGLGRENTKEAEYRMGAVHFYIEYEDGHRLSLDIDDESDIELLRPLMENLFEYYDTLFEEEQDS